MPAQPPPLLNRRPRLAVRPAAPPRRGRRTAVPRRVLEASAWPRGGAARGPRARRGGGRRGGASRGEGRRRRRPQGPERREAKQRSQRAGRNLPETPRRGRTETPRSHRDPEAAPRERPTSAQRTARAKPRDAEDAWTRGAQPLQTTKTKTKTKTEKHTRRKKRHKTRPSHTQQTAAHAIARLLFFFFFFFPRPTTSKFPLAPFLSSPPPSARALRRPAPSPLHLFPPARRFLLLQPARGPLGAFKTQTATESHLCPPRGARASPPFSSRPAPETTPFSGRTWLCGRRAAHGRFGSPALGRTSAGDWRERLARAGVGMRGPARLDLASNELREGARLRSRPLARAIVARGAPARIASPGLDWARRASSHPLPARPRERGLHPALSSRQRSPRRSSRRRGPCWRRRAWAGPFSLPSLSYRSQETLTR